MPSDARRFRRFLALALAAHIALLVAARVGRETAHRAGEVADSLVEFDIEPADLPAVQPVSPAVPSPPLPAAERPTHQARRPAVAPPSSDSKASHADDLIGGEVQTGGSAAETWGFSATKGGTWAAIGQAQRDTIASELRNGARQDAARGSKTGGVVEKLDESDVERGFGRGGAVVAAIEEVVRESPTRPVGAVDFMVTIRRVGGVVATLLNGEGPAGFAALTAAIERRVAKATVRIPGGAEGLRVIVRVDARDLLYDGKAPRPNGVKLRASPGAIHATKESVAIELPSVAVLVKAGSCTVAVSPLGIGGDCMLDLPATYQVHGRIVREERL